MSEYMEKFLEAHMEYQSGLSEEKAKNQKEIVLNMYHNNVNLETISKYTKLSILEIEKIISE